MGRGPRAIGRSDVIWAIKVVQKAGLDVVKTEIHPDGRVVLYHQLEPIPERLEETFEDRRERTALEAKRQLPEVCTPKMLADIWGCSTRHVRKLARAGELRSFTLGKHMIRIKREEAEAFQARLGTPIVEPEASAIEPATDPSSKRPRARRLDIGPNASLRAFKAQRG